MSSEMEEPRIWRELCELILSYLIIFNWRWQGEVLKIKSDDFCKAKCGGGETDINRCLSKMEQQVCRLFYRLEVVGKRGPLLIDGEIFEIVQLLNWKRKLAGVAAANSFLFPLNNYSSLSHVRGSDCLRKLSVQCEANIQKPCDLPPSGSTWLPCPSSWVSKIMSWTC